MTEVVYAMGCGSGGGGAETGRCLPQHRPEVLVEIEIVAAVASRG
ncbi:hypothetical protein [Streptomyces sp. SLBN-31]|nr:hypothetical protein [Streptomyces sp. SLBN-31]